MSWCGCEVLLAWLLAQGKLSMQLLLTFLSVVAGRAMQVYTSANYTRALVGGVPSLAPTWLAHPASPCCYLELLHIPASH